MHNKNATPAAYLRRSYVDPDSPGDISLEAQRTAVRKLAAADGHNGNVIEYNDWGISADIAKSGKRTEYARLLADMEAGKVAAVYAFDVDRLYRDPRDLIRLQDAAQRHDVRIVTTGGPLAIGDGDDPAAEAFAFIGSVFGRMELQKAKKRARAGREARRARGDVMGHPPFGYRHVRDASGRIVRELDPGMTALLAQVRAAYVSAGTVLGAAKRLNADGVPGPKGGAWHPSALTRTIEQHWPELLPKRSATTGKRIHGPSLFSQLIRCHCGHVMTPNVARHQLYCSRAKTDASHGQYNVSEVAILPFVQQAFAAITLPDAATVEANVADQRAVIEQRWQRANELYLAGSIDRERHAAEQDRHDSDLSDLPDEDEVLREVPGLDWKLTPPEAINEVLRAVFRHVALDADMKPVEAPLRIRADLRSAA